MRYKKNKNGKGPTSATSHAFINNETALSGSFCSTILVNIRTTGRTTLMANNIITLTTKSHNQIQPHTKIY